MRRAWGALAAALAACVCAVEVAGAAVTTFDSRGTIVIDGTKTFPVGLLRPPPVTGTTPTGADAWSDVVAAGVDVLAVGPYGRDWSPPDLADVQAAAAAAAARGAYAWVNLRELARAQPESPDDVLLQTVVTALKDSTGLGMWKGPDEPWLSGWPASLLQHAYEVTRSIDPNHLWDVIQAPRGTAADLAPYSAVTDGHGIDVYPVRFGVPSPNLHAVGKWTKRVRSVTPNRVVLTTLQICFSGSDDPAGSGAYVLPTRRQLRYMAYDAILNGARGLVFFGGGAVECMQPRDEPYGWNWSFWEGVLERLVREVGPKSRLHAALVSPGTGVPLHWSDGRTQVRSRVAGGDLWIIAARHGPGTARVTIRDLPRWASRAAVYREGRTIRARNGSFSDTFARWGVHVYRFRG
jgi:hypothetical protein